MKVLLVVAVVALVQGSDGKYVCLFFLSCTVIQSPQSILFYCSFVMSYWFNIQVWLWSFFRNIFMQLLSLDFVVVCVCLFLCECVCVCLPVCFWVCFISPFCHTDGFPLVVTRLRWKQEMLVESSRDWHKEQLHIFYVHVLYGDTCLHRIHTLTVRK